MQGKLLRVLQEGEFERVGEERTRKVNVRIIAATNRNLQAEVEHGRFRQDLYYRLNVFPVSVPPLKDRREDIVPLATNFLRLAGREFGRNGLALSRAQAEVLQMYDWPGNIRELRNVVERAVILSEGDRLRLDLAMPTLGLPADAPHDDVAASTQSWVTDSEFRRLERDNLVAALEHADWRVSGEGGAAALLGLKPNTLSYRMKTLGVRKGNRRRARR